MLTQQLAILLEDGWVLRRDFGEIPPHTEYRLSGLGQSFMPILHHIYDWGVTNNITELVNTKYNIAGQNQDSTCIIGSGQ
jgi:DNA-binding HxlR family transcriptional regulator